MLSLNTAVALSRAINNLIRPDTGIAVTIDEVRRMKEIQKAPGSDAFKVLALQKKNLTIFVLVNDREPKGLIRYKINWYLW